MITDVSSSPPSPFLEDVPPCPSPTLRLMIPGATPPASSLSPVLQADPVTPMSTVPPMELASPVPTTPVVPAEGRPTTGKVVKKGTTEKTGRWSEEEHKIFLEGLQRHGKQWKTIATMIGTRTVVQVRTHAQKYFQKIERKGSKGGSNAGSGNSNDGKEASSGVQQQNRKPTSSENKSSSSAPKGGAGKRNSLPSALPSRKKAKTSPALTPKPIQRVSISLGSLPPSPLPTEPENYFEHCSSSENLSTISPTGVVESDLHLVSSSSSSWQKESLYLSEDSIPASGAAAADFGEDALEWLIDDGIHHLPESSLENAPIFPDLEHSVSGENFSLQLQPEYHAHVSESSLDGAAPNVTEHHHHAPPVLSSASSVDALDDIADPKVTVQALFLDGEGA